MQFVVTLDARSAPSEGRTQFKGDIALHVSIAKTAVRQMAISSLRTQWG